MTKHLQVLPKPADQPGGSGRGFSVLNMVQFLGASTIVGFVTWSLGSYISAKANQQQQLNTFINTISDFMIQNNLDGQAADKPQLPAVSRAARGYALNTLSTLDGLPLVEDKPKKLALLKFLYDSELIGFCKNNVLGNTSLSQSKLVERCLESRINLKDARLVGLNFSTISLVLRGINLSGTNLSGSDFSNIDLTSARFVRSNLRGVNFSNSLLPHADLSWSYLVDANLRQADLSQANLSNAQLCGADLSEAGGLDSAIIDSVTIDAATRIPAAFKQRLLANQGKMQACQATTLAHD